MKILEIEGCNIKGTEYECPFLNHLEVGRTKCFHPNFNGICPLKSTTTREETLKDVGEWFINSCGKVARETKVYWVHQSKVDNLLQGKLPKEG